MAGPRLLIVVWIATTVGVSGAISTSGTGKPDGVAMSRTSRSADGLGSAGPKGAQPGGSEAEAALRKSSR